MLTIGGLLTSAALLVLGGCAVAFRRPDAPRWMTRSWVHELTTITFACLLVVGVGHLVAGGASAYREGPDLIDLGLSIGVLVGATMIWRRLDVRARLRAYEAAAAAVHAPGNAGGSRASPMPAPEGAPTARSDLPPRTPRERAA